MKIIHHISFASTPSMRAELAAIGIEIGENDLEAFDIAESTDSWPLVAAWIARNRVQDLVRTEYEREELLAADWLLMRGTWIQGYPEPKSDEDGFVDVTFDVSERCGSCGRGSMQCAPFRIRGEPKWGRRGAMSLNWIHEEIFFKAEVFSKHLQPLGLGYWPVQNARGKELKTVVQLRVDEHKPLDLEGLPQTICPDCGRVAFTVPARDPFPAPSTPPSGQAFKITQFIGKTPGGERRIIVSHRVARALVEADVRGVGFRPATRQSPRPPH
jgi:hypothetical protein